LYRVALKHKNLRVIFQNADDKEKLLSTRAIVPSQTVIIRGSGVSLGEYPYLPEPEGLPVVAMAARLLKEKGICEFVEAARILKARNIKADMRLIGSPDFGNPSSVTEEELARWKAEGVVNLLGFRTDIAAQYAKSNIVCLPSYYGEGLPKSLIEAAACGRAVVTTDMPGCRDAITPDETGILIEPRNAVALADAIQYLIENPTVRMKIGEAGRKLAENAFTIESVVEQHMSIYQELLANASEK
jgi:glycosyltransferase involved in cell wall biosynthesis